MPHLGGVLLLLAAAVGSAASRTRTQRARSPQSRGDVCSEAVEGHRRTVHEAILDTTWWLVAEPWAAVGDDVADRRGHRHGRARLYEYFPDVQAILAAGHERHVTSHLERLKELRNQPGDAQQRLAAVVVGYALIAYHRERHGNAELAPCCIGVIT